MFVSFRAFNKESTEIDCTSVVMFLEEVKADYQNASSSQLCTALSKFAEQYHSVKSKSIPWLISFLYDIHHDLNPTAHVKSGLMIRVQVESVKRQK